MLNTHQFIEDLNDIQRKIYNSFFLKEVDRSNLSPIEKAEMDIKLFEMSSNTALRLQELMQRERELEFNLYQKRTELEINIIQAKAQATRALSEAIISVIQAYVTKNSVTDNANIQRANIYTQLIQIIANASNLNAISQKDEDGNSHISNAINIISKIKDTENPTLDNALNNCIQNLIDRSNEIMLLGAGSQDIFIYTPKKELQVDEIIEIQGIHIFSNNECEFVIQGKTIKGKTTIFKSDTEGNYEIIFRVKNMLNEWIETKITLIVKENIIDSMLPARKIKQR